MTLVLKILNIRSSNSLVIETVRNEKTIPPPPKPAVFRVIGLHPREKQWI
jgi:hypothetical protein